MVTANWSLCASTFTGGPGALSHQAVPQGWDEGSAAFLAPLQLAANMTYFG